MATSTVRFVIVGAAVIAGALVIANTTDSQTTAIGPVTPSSPVAPTTQPPPTSTPKSPGVAGVKVAVFNGTKVTGAATRWCNKIVHQGYGHCSPGNASSAVATTAVYYVGGHDVFTARYLAINLFGVHSVTQVPATIHAPLGVRVVVLLGSDQASSA